MQQPPFPPVAARRAVLGAGLAAAGFVVAGAPARAAEAAQTLQVLPPQSTTRIATGPRSQVRLPGVLGARLRTGAAALPSGTAVHLSWDRRVYRSTVPVLVAGDGRRVPLRLVGRPTFDRTTGIAAATVRTGAELSAGGNFVLTIGSPRLLRYPDDVVVDPAPVTVTVGGAGRGARRSLGAAPSTVSLWGAVVSAGWEPFTWGDGMHAWLPTLVTVRAVGPGDIPAGTAVEVLIDARVASEVRAVAAGATEVARGQQYGDRIQLRWTFNEPLTDRTRRSVRLDVRTAAPLGDLANFQAPTVSLTAPQGDMGQRTTGAESVSRSDNAVDPDTLRMFGFQAS